MKKKNRSKTPFVLGDVWSAPRGINLIQPPSPEKTLKKWFLNHHFENPQYRACFPSFEPLSGQTFVLLKEYPKETSKRIPIKRKNTEPQSQMAEHRKTTSKEIIEAQEDSTKTKYGCYKTCPC